MRSRLPVLALSAVIAFAAPDEKTHGIDPAEYHSLVRTLSSEEMRGRGTGTKELDKAARFLAAEFRKAGLQPAANGSYLQSFPVTVASRLGERNRLRWTNGSEGAELALSVGFLPLSFSGSARVSAPVVFAGYGISAPEYGYDDYADLDVNGKIVVVLRHEPQEFDRDSPFEGRVYTEHGQLASKAGNARRRGAAAVILVNDTSAHSGADPLDRFTSFTAPGDPGIPVVQVRADVVEGWFRIAAKDFKAAQETLDGGKPQSFSFPGQLRIELETDLRHTQRPVFNVAAYLPGQSSEYVVVGAHYDHLGLGEQYSMASGAAGTAHPGADDNASGTAGLVQLARYFARMPRQRRGILFLAFAGEELGLLGSGHYVHHPLLPPGEAVAMLNMDMIGRLREHRLIIGGTQSGSTFPAVLAEAQRRSELKIDTAEDVVYGSSDHTSFLTLQLPVLFFFTGLHADYHRPSDTWEKVDAQGTTRVLDFVADVLSSLANSAERPQFVRRAVLPVE